jgi:cytosine/adenosine deaminase-related metal-dependent hydrolase
LQVATIASPVSIPLCLLDGKDGGDGGSEAIASVTLVVGGGKIRDIMRHADANATADNMSAIDLEGGIIWPACADLHTGRHR